MKIVKKGLWWKPFSTFINCNNVTGGDCIPDISAEECIQKCEDDDACQLGYHIEFEKTNKQYCVPISTTYKWGNETPLISLISSKNPTLLSTDKGVKWTGFYNDKRYPSFTDLPKDFFSYIFSGMRVYLRTLDTQYYFTTTGFSKNKTDAVLMMISPSKSSIFDPNQRISFKSIVSFFQDNKFIHLKFQSDSNSFSWQPVYDSLTKTAFRFLKVNDNNTIFINQMDPFYLQVDNRFVFLSTNNQLITDPIHKTSFVFEIDPNNIYNKYREKLFRYGDSQDNLDTTKIDPEFTSSLYHYICSQYQCYPIFEGSSATMTNWILSIEILTIIIIILLSLLRSILK